MHSISKILLNASLPLVALVFTGNTAHVLGAGETCHSSSLGAYQDSIEKTCAEAGEDKWPDCRMTFSTFLLKPDNSGLVGKTSCDDGCSFSSAFSCASKIADCVSPCTSSPTSNQCLTCVSNLGSCCDCLAYAVGKVSNSAGQTVCNLCPAASMYKGNLQGSPGVGGVTKAPTLGDLVLTTSESRNALLPQSHNHAPHLELILGCKFYDVKCIFNKAKCGVCKKAIPALLGLGSEAACDVGCVAAVELAGGGPADPVADAVALACPALCVAAYKAAAGQSANAICKAAKLC